jgi:hypothetical protein
MKRSESVFVSRVKLDPGTFDQVRQRVAEATEAQQVRGSLTNVVLRVDVAVLGNLDSKQLKTINRDESLYIQFRSNAIIDYRCEDRKKIGDFRDDIGAIRMVLIPSFRKPRSSPQKKRTVQPGDEFEDTAF